MTFLANGIIVSFFIEVMHRYRDRYAMESILSKEAHDALKESTQHYKSILDHLFVLTRIQF